MDPCAKKFLWIGGLAGGAAAALILFCFDPARVPIYPVCLFHQTTGLDCPGCGSLRAVHQLLHGHVLAALQLNVLTILSLPLLGIVLLRVLWTELKGGPAFHVRPLWLWLYLGMWVAFGVLRDLPLNCFAWLAA